MAEGTFYERRMQELNNQQSDFVANTTGIPVSRPQAGVQGSGMATNPMPQDQTAQQLQDFQKSHFGMMHDHYMQNDPHYGAVVDNLTQLSLALKDQVDNGFMPMSIAQDKIHQFIQDHREGYKKGNNQKVLQGQMAAGAMQQQLAQQNAQQQAPVPEAPDASITTEENSAAEAGNG